jgi:hypothetical protein
MSNKHEGALSAIGYITGWLLGTTIQLAAFTGMVYLALLFISYMGWGY